MIYKGIYSLLSTNSDVTDIVGEKIFPVEVPEDIALPYIAYLLPDEEHLESLRGSSGSATVDCHVECYSADFVECRNLKEAVRMSMQGFIGTAAGIQIKATLMPKSPMGYIPPSDASEHVTYICVCQFRITYVEEKPTF